MGMKHFKPYTPSRRNMTVSDFSEITKKTPEKSLLAKKKEKAGRNSYGRITVRHQGGGNRQKYRIIDFKRKKDTPHPIGCKCILFMCCTKTVKFRYNIKNIILILYLKEVIFYI